MRYKIWGLRYEMWLKTSLLPSSQLEKCTHTRELDFRKRNFNFLMDLLLSIICYQLAQQGAAFQSSGDNNCHPSAVHQPAPPVSGKLISAVAFLLVLPVVYTPVFVLSAHSLSSALTITSQELWTFWTFWTPAWDFQFAHPGGEQWRLDTLQHTSLPSLLTDY